MRRLTAGVCIIAAGLGLAACGSTTTTTRTVVSLRAASSVPTGTSAATTSPTTAAAPVSTSGSTSTTPQTAVATPAAGPCDGHPCIGDWSKEAAEGGDDQAASTTVAAVAASDPQPAPTATGASTAPTNLHLHPHAVVLATTLPDASDSRAPKLPAGAAKAVATSSADGQSGSGASSEPTAGGAALGPDARASFTRLQDRIGSQAHVSLAVQPLGRGPLQVFGSDPPMLAMSTSKVLILSALLLDKRGPGRLSAEQRALARTAITESDNNSILSLFGDLEADKGGLDGASTYATGLLRTAGDDHTVVSTAPVPPGYATSFGQTPWSPSDEVLFFRALTLGCVIPAASVNYELGLMRQIVPSESWGVGSAGFSQVAFKGGWGPLPGGYGVRQTAVIGSGSSAVVASVAADPATDFGTGQAVLTDIGRWLHAHLRLQPRAEAGCAR
jgi:hypothetical protein